MIFRANVRLTVNTTRVCALGSSTAELKEEKPDLQSVLSTNECSIRLLRMGILVMVGQCRR